MRDYIIRRLLLTIPTLIIVSLIVFFTLRLIPGDIIDLMAAGMGGESGGAIGVIDRDAIEATLGLNVPMVTQYGRWIGVIPGADGSFSGILQGNLGTSLWKKVPVLTNINSVWPITLELSILALIVAQLIALPIGVYSAMRQNTAGDYIARSFAIGLLAIPGFWLATMVIVFPSIWWGYSPSIEIIPFIKDPIGNLKMFLIPAVILGAHMAGLTMRMTRTMMLEVLRQDYIKTAWAKGLKERIVIMRHALKNALIPIITIIGIQVPVLIGGTVIIENIFNLPGMSRLIIESTFRRDYPIVSGALLFFGGAIVLINLVVDLAYAYLDSRIRYK